MNRLYLRFFGRFDCTLNDTPVKITSPKSQALLAWVALQPDPAHSRDALATLLWPEHNGQQAKQNLRKTLSRLRKLLPDHLSTSRTSIERIGDWQSDVSQFDAALDVEEWEAGAAIYGDDFLLGLGLDSAEFETWQLLKREQLRRRFLQALANLTSDALAHNNYSLAYQTTVRRCAHDPYDEEAHQQMMRCLALQDRSADALAQYQKLRRLLAEELDVEPAAATTALYEKIKAGEIQPLPLGAATGTKQKHNLPPERTPFVGRTALLDTAADQLSQPDCKLLTLVGMGGMGKTRSSIAIATRLLSDFDDGVWFVSLASVGNRDEEITDAVATALAIKFPKSATSPEMRQAHVVKLIGQRNLLLILDNYETVIERVGLLSDLLITAPNLKIIVTSREPLYLQAEWLLHVDGLERDEARGLFVAAARRVNPHFVVDDVAVAEIVRLTGGAPLALELAASWGRSFSAELIATQLQSNIDLLQTKMRDATPRHRSIRAIFEQTWALLNESEQAIFAKLSLFNDPFTPTAAAAVADAGPLQLETLLSRSMVTRRDERFELHPLMRQFSAEKRSLLPDPSTPANRHSQHFLSTLASIDRQTVRTIRPFINDIKAAWQSAIANKQIDRLLAARANLLIFFEQRGAELEGARFLSDAIAQLAQTAAPQASLLEASLRNDMGELCFPLAHIRKGVAHVERAIEIVRQQQPSTLLIAVEARATCLLAELRYRLGENEQPLTLVQHALALAEQAGDERLLVRCLIFAAKTATEDTREAQQKAERAISISMQLGDGLLLGRCYQLLGYNRIYHAKFEAALHWFLQAYAQYDAVSAPFLRANLANSIGMIQLHINRVDEAIAYFNQALPILGAHYEGGAYGLTLGNIGAAHTQLDQFDLAESYLQRAGKIFGEYQLLDMLADNNRRLGLLLTRMGRLDAGLMVLEQALAGYERVENWRGKAIALSYVTVNRLWAGELDSAEISSLAASTAATRSGQQRAEAHALMQRGRLLLHQNQPDEATAVLSQAVVTWGEIGLTLFLQESRALLAAAHLARNDVAAAQTVATPILAYLADGNALHGAIDPANVLLVCGRSLAALGQVEQAQALYQQAVAWVEGVSAEIASPRDRAAFRTKTPSHSTLLSQRSSY